MSETMQLNITYVVNNFAFIKSQLNLELQRLREIVALDKVAPTLTMFHDTLVTPIVNEHIYHSKVEEYERKIKEFKSEHPDFDCLLPEIQRTVAENHYLNDLPDGLETAYKMAREKVKKIITSQGGEHNEQAF